MNQRAQRHRADLLLVEKGLAKSRAEAQALLLAGRVYRGEERIDKAGTLVARDTELTVRRTSPFASRGGDKLEGALQEFMLDVRGSVAADIGASTGGFTDCLLQRGAKKVFAVDVGHGQLAEKLRGDVRVVVMERTNARHLTRAALGEAVNLVVVDASFISLELLLASIHDIMQPGAQLIALVKPQFEVGREEASRSKGVIKDEAVRQAAIAKVIASVEGAGFTLEGQCASALKGPKGNLEHFLWAAKPPGSTRR